MYYFIFSVYSTSSFEPRNFYETAYKIYKMNECCIETRWERSYIVNSDIKYMSSVTNLSKSINNRDQLKGDNFIFFSYQKLRHTLLLDISICCFLSVRSYSRYRTSIFFKFGLRYMSSGRQGGFFYFH